MLSINKLLTLDRKLFDLVAKHHSPELDKLLPFLSRSADRSKLWILIALGLAAYNPEKYRQAAIDSLICLSLNSLLVNLGLKSIFKRPRPQLTWVPEPRRLKKELRTTSFPSGHSSSAFAFATSLSLEAPQLAPLLFILASGVAGSRIYVGAHYPLDVAVGALVGGGLAVGLEKQILKIY